MHADIGAKGLKGLFHGDFTLLGFCQNRARITITGTYLHSHKIQTSGK